MVWSFVQYFLLLFAIRSECTVEILRPLREHDIQLLSGNAKYDESTNMTSYSLSFKAPPDTIMELMDYRDTPLIAELRSQAFSVLRADILVSLGEDYHLNLRSPSTVDQLAFTITGRPVSTSEEVFTDINCKYGIRKETYDVITKYSTNVDECQHTFAHFSAQLRDGKSHGGSYVGFNDTLNKYANETGTVLWLNEDAMERIGVKLVELNFLIILSEKPLFDIVPFYTFGWGANLTQSAHSD